LKDSLPHITPFLLSVGPMLRRMYDPENEEILATILAASNMQGVIYKHDHKNTIVLE
jgi:hypothetical protein